MNKTTDSFANFDVVQADHLSEDEDIAEAWFEQDHARHERKEKSKTRRKTLQRKPQVESFDPAKTPNAKRRKLADHILRVPTNQPFKFSTPKSLKPKAFLFNGDNDDVIIFKGNFRPAAKKTKRTISMDRINQLAQPRKRILPSVNSNRSLPKPKSMQAVQAMLARPVNTDIRSEKVPTVPIKCVSNMEKRAEERKALKREREIEKEAEEKAKEEKESEDRIKEAEFMRHFRSTLIHKAAPIRQYKGIKPVMSKPTTVALYPKFQTAKRKRTN